MSEPRWSDPGQGPEDCICDTNPGECEAHDNRGATYVARFNPQAWINDYAIEVDPEGEQEWDVTRAFNRLRPDYRRKMLDEIFDRGEALDRHDYLKEDPHAPEWVREWRGPFDIWVRDASRWDG